MISFEFLSNNIHLNKQRKGDENNRLCRHISFRFSFLHGIIVNQTEKIRLREKFRSKRFRCDYSKERKVLKCFHLRTKLFFHRNSSYTSLHLYKEIIMWGGKICKRHTATQTWHSIVSFKYAREQFTL